ncbi:MAG: FadR family transcriptional regulator [Chloroflexi bacterium]|nr:FadR family transcriptional regulator [Chloroflexota bacterium]
MALQDDRALLRPPRVQTLQEAVVQQLKEYIIASGLRPGDRLPTEEDLARQLGVSRTAVREALRALEALGIISVRHGAGRFVQEFSFQPILDNLAYSILYDLHTFEELLEVREKLEAGFLEEVVAGLTPDTLAELRHIVARMQEKVARNAPKEALMEEDMCFHRALYANVNNRLLFKLLEIFWDVQKRLRARIPHEAEDRADFVRQHEAIVDALEARDVALARTRLLAHFQGVRAWIAQEKAAADRTATFSDDAKRGGAS